MLNLFYSILSYSYWVHTSYNSQAYSKSGQKHVGLLFSEIRAIIINLDVKLHVKNHLYHGFRVKRLHNFTLRVRLFNPVTVV
jgi:hypothetical protein